MCTVIQKQVDKEYLDELFIYKKIKNKNFDEVIIKKAQIQSGSWGTFYAGFSHKIKGELQIIPLKFEDV